MACFSNSDNYFNSPHGSYQTQSQCHTPDTGFGHNHGRHGHPNNGTEQTPIYNHGQTTSPISSSASSPDTLPARGYTYDQLAAYIGRKLNGPQWIVELDKQQILDNIQDALVKYSQYKPALAYGAIRLQDSVHTYLEGVDVGQGIANVDFVESRPAPTELFYGNLISPAPILSTGIDEYDLFLRWRKTWMRASSVKPNWLYDEINRCLYIHNPVERYTCSILAYFNWNIQCLPQFGANWVKEYSLAACEQQLGNLYMKYSGAIPSPNGNLQLDSKRRDDAQAKLDKLDQQLFNSQESSPLSID